LQPWIPQDFGEEQLARVWNGSETHGFTGRDGSIYLVASNMHTRLDVLETNGLGGVISYRHAGPRHIVAQNTGPLAIPGCDPSTTRANRFTKGTIVEGITSEGDSILLLAWGWGGVKPCPDLRDYAEDSHEVFFAYSRDGGETWFNREGTQSRTAPVCRDELDCVQATHGIAFNDPAFIVSGTRQREHRGLWYDTATDTVYLVFTKSKWCDSGICLVKNVTDPGALMLLRFSLGTGQVDETLVDRGGGNYTHISALRKGADGVLYLYASDGNFFEHLSLDGGTTWEPRTRIEFSRRFHGVPRLPCSPSTMLNAGASVNGPLYLHRRTTLGP
jgi:hypothetical protein